MIAATSGGCTAEGVPETTTGSNEEAAATESVETRATRRRVRMGDGLTFLWGEGCLAAFLLDAVSTNVIRLPALGDFATLSGTLIDDSAARSPRVGDGRGDTVMVDYYWIYFDRVG